MKIRLENIIRLFKSAYRKVKTFFHHYRGKDILIFLFFLLLSLGFWILLSLQEDYEIQVSIPVNYKNVSPDIAFVQTPPSEITARIKDKGTVLLNYTLGKKMAALDIDIDLSGKNNVLLFPEKEIENTILKRLHLSTSLLSYSPSKIEVAYSKLMNKKLPVEFDGSIQTEQGFQVSGDIVIDPPVVDVYASNMILDTLHQLNTVYTEIQKGKKTIERELELSPPEGVITKPEKVLVVIPIEEYTEKSLELPIIAKGVPLNFMIRMFPAKAHVICNVPLSRFKDLSESDFSLEISVDDHDQNISGMLPVLLVKKPDWVDDVTITPSTVEFLLEQSAADD